MGEALGVLGSGCGGRGRVVHSSMEPITIEMKRIVEGGSMELGFGSCETGTMVIVGELGIWAKRWACWEAGVGEGVVSFTVQWSR